MAEAGRQAAWSGAVVGAIGASGLLGWRLGWGWPTRWLDGHPGMSPRTALAVVLLGSAVAAAGAARRGRAWSRLAVWAAAAALAALCGPVLVAYLRSGEALDPGSGAARTSPQTAVALLLMALGLAASLGGVRRRHLTAAGAIGAALVALTALAGHIHGAVTLFAVTDQVGMSLPTAAGVLLGAYGLASLDLDAWPRRPTSPGTSTWRHIRLLALAALAIPFTIDALLELGVRVGWYGDHLGDALHVVSTAVLLAIAVGWASRGLLRAEQEREALAQEHLARKVAEAMTRNLEGQLAERQRLLAEVSEALRTRDRFLSFASHELRTPLTALRLQVEGLLRASEAKLDDRERLRTALGRARDQVGRLGRIVANLVDASRVAEGRVQLVAQEVELAGLVREVADRFADRLARAGAALVLQLDPVEGRWDPDALDHVLSNLLDNAVKYGGGRPVCLRLSASPAGIRLEVEDQGIGVPASDRERIFERYHRAGGLDDVEGLGLGLWIARQLVEGMGGRLSVADRPEGPGSVFAVDLPRQAAAERGPAMAGPAAGLPREVERPVTGLPPGLVTGDPDLDAQHRGILEEAARLRAAPLHAAWASVDFLSWHTAAHFAFEERLMQELAYPDRQAHGEEHARFLASLTTRRAGLEHGGATPENVRALASLVEEWVTSHVSGSDVALAAFVRAARRSQALARP